MINCAQFGSLALAICASVCAEAAEPPVGARPELVELSAHTATSPPLIGIASAPLPPSARDEAAVRDIVRHRVASRIPMTPPRRRPDVVLQRSAAGPFAPTVLAPTLGFSFEGISNADNFAQFGFRVLPPDANGDVGPHHYVQAVNLLIQVYDKATGTPLLPAPAKISSLFAAAGPPCATTDDGDPIVLYDSLADRWLVTQFAVVGPPDHQCVAISQTPDPTGAYFLYDFVMPNAKLNDYTKFGIWPDAYYMTDNQFDASGVFVGVGVFAFDRAKMLAGDASAASIYFDLESVLPGGGMLPADVDGPAPPLGTPGYFAVLTATAFGDPQDALRIFELRAAFANPTSSTFTERPESPLPTAAFSPLFDCGASGLDCIRQPPPAGKNARLDVISENLMHRLQYRNFGTDESLVANHTVDVDGTDHAGIRYYELRRSLPGGTFAIQEQASFAPDASHRWMGSAAVDRQGNLAVGYSVSSTTVFPAIRYAGRLATDPPGGLFQGEATIQAGGGSQTSTASRWGDYSMLAVDPVDDCTFWFTSEYYATSSDRGWQTRIGRFKFTQCTPAPSPTATMTPTATATASPSATPTAAMYAVSGAIRYYAAEATPVPVAGTEVHFDGPAAMMTLSDVDGHFALSAASGRVWQLEPRKFGDVNNAITAFDASFVLQAAVGRLTLTPAQQLAGDVTGNGTLSAFDASLILQRSVDLIEHFPLASCTSDWAFIPMPASATHQRIIQPQSGPGPCTRGAIAFEPLSNNATGQDFLAVLYGDVSGNWRPAQGAAAAAAVIGAGVRLGTLRPGHGRRVRMPIYAEELASLTALDLTLYYDPAAVRLIAVRRPAPSRAALLEFNGRVPGILRIAMASAQGIIAGKTPLLAIDFDRLGRRSPRVRIVRSSLM